MANIGKVHSKHTLHTQVAGDVSSEVKTLTNWDPSVSVVIHGNHPKIIVSKFERQGVTQDKASMFLVIGYV